MQKKDLKKYNLPDSPGVYFFLGLPKLREGDLGLPKLYSEGDLGGKRLDLKVSQGPTSGSQAGGNILYIGKATSLKDRVRSYFSKDLIDTRGPLIHQMVFKAKDLDWQKTDSVLEALILEANLIKKYQPYFNTKEKDDKSFYFVGITGEEYPKVILIRERNLEKSKNKIVFSKTYGPFTNGGQLKEALKIIRKIFPFLDDKSKSYYHFYRQIELAPEIKEKENKSYLNNIKNIKLFFEGKKKSILKSLEKDMKNLAKEMRFEEAGEIKRKIFALKHINDVALIKEENINFANQKFSGAQVKKKNYDFSQVLGSPTHDFKIELAQPDHSKNHNSFHIDPVVDFGNAQNGRAPHFAKIHYRVEAYDIAHMSGQNMVGVMVVSINGEFEKSEYKKFNIKSQTGANDAGALKEVLERRFTHKEWQYPSVIIMDGNIIQINVAKKVLENLGINIPIVSVVKDDKHKAREILGDKKVVEKYKKEILALNAEAHRFAINFHKQKRNKNFLT